MISSKAVIHPNVKLGENVTIEDFCEIGVPPKGFTSGQRPTIIGDNSIIRSGSVVYAGNKIGKNFQTGHKANIRENNTIGDNVSIGTLSVVEHHVTIEDNVRLHTQVFVPEYTTLRKNCWLGPNVVITNASYPKSPHVKKELKGPLIEEDAIIGANSTILPGLTLGAHCLVGAGSVVTKDIAAKDVVAGNPARKIKSKDDLPYGELE